MNINNQWFHWQGFGYFQADSPINGVMNLQGANKSESKWWRVVKGGESLITALRCSRKVYKQIKVRNKHYSLSHCSVSSKNLIEVFNGELGGL